MMRRTYLAGFTLAELVIGMALMAVVLTVVANITTSIMGSNRLLSSQSQMTTEGQLMQRLLSGRISEAIYIYPPDTVMALSSRGETTANTIAGSTQNWKVNTDPFIAMILPPENPIYAAGTGAPGTIAPTNCSSTNADGCYRFYAFYAVKRSNLANSTTLAASSRPAKDPLNPDSWVLMQYKANLVGWMPGYSTPSQGFTQPLPASTLYQGGSGVLLADYIQPATGTNKLFPTGTCQIFCVTLPTRPAGSTVPSNNGQVDIRFRMQQVIEGGKTLSVQGVKPDTASPPSIGGVVSPRNWWK